MRKFSAFAAALFAVAFGWSLQARAAQPPLILRNPTLSKTQIAFTYAGSIWIVNRQGGSARRLVTGFNLEGAPYFSPDGSMVAFSGEYDGNTDVYVVPASGGEPKRLTYHPLPDVAVGWTPDGKNVLFSSLRESFADSSRLYTVPAGGGIAKALPFDMAEAGSMSPDGKRIAIVPEFQWEPQWQHYRGGQTTEIWLGDLSDSSVVKIPRNNSNDRNPMWVGDNVYFISDRNGPATLFSYNTRNNRVTQLVENHAWDMLSADAGPGGIVYAQLGSLHLYDTSTGREHAVPVSISAELPEVRPHWLRVAGEIQNASLSPTGVRAVFEAHGEILTVPAEHGDVRNLTQSPGVEERDPAWSPDGRSIAFFSDAGGEYSLHIVDQRGLHPARSIALGPQPSFFYGPAWSPDSKKIAYSDKHLRLWYVDVTQSDAKPVLVDTAPFESFGPSTFAQAWSPDSRWITYQKQLDNYLHAVFVYDVSSHTAHQITDGMSDSQQPAFDRDGKYLYFLASTNTGLTANGLDMAGDQRPVSSSVYAFVLGGTQPSPIKVETGDEPETAAEPAQGAQNGAKKPAEQKENGVTIDFSGVSQRIIALPIPQANYIGLATGGPGDVFLSQAPLTSVDNGPTTFDVLKWSGAARQVIPMASDVSYLALSADGKKMLTSRNGLWFITGTQAPPKPYEGMISTSGLEVYTDPRKEWDQMYRETWRIERDFFYDKHFGGLDIGQAQQRFAAFLPGLGGRDDLTFLTHQMLSYLATGHMWVGGGQRPFSGRVSVGMLGADYTVDDNRYRFAKIYNGENWNPELRAPLTQPGDTVKEGEYLLAVNGRPLHADQDIYEAFQETAGKQTTLLVAQKPDGTGERTVTVTPLRSERMLRNLAWIEHNRREVDRLSGGKLAYVYLPDTEFGGFTNFNRYFFSQVNRQGVILDERFNHGGQIADYIIDMLNRRPMSILEGRDGKTMVDPPLAIYGPKVMIINQFAGSGGDAMPWYFRKAKIGPLVGMRTWGGLVGIGGYPSLMDGGTVMAPRIAIGGLNGRWEVEGEGIPPDVPVWQDPKLTRQGRDPQLEAAVATAMQMLREHPVPAYSPPAMPEHHLQVPTPPRKRK